VLLSIAQRLGATFQPCCYSSFSSWPYANLPTLMSPRFLSLRKTSLHKVCSFHTRAFQAHPSHSARISLHGRFLHITDIHPDEHYRADASVSSSCHRRKPKRETSRSGYWGAPYTDCDTSLRLMNLTFDYLEDNWADKIDFVICEHCNH
jgi:hypothetical protein